MDFQVLSKAKADIHSIEQELSVSIPADYKAFLIEHNGICTENTIVRIEAIEEETLLNVLFSCDNQLNRALTLEYWNTEYKDDIPEGALLIGDFQDGGFLFLIPAGNDKGVYYYDHAYTFESSDDDGNTYLLADTFEAFINSLK